MRFPSFLTRHHSTIASASIILAISSLLSRLLGLFRDRLLAGKFGTGSLLDAYQISFLLPDFIYNLFIVGALSAAFIPIFVEIYEKSKTRAWELGSRLLNLLSLFIIFILFLCFLFTPQLINLLGRLSETAGTHYNQENLDLIVNLTRLMLLSPLLLGISGLFTSILQSLKHFLAPALAPLLYNLGIIFGIIVLNPLYGIYGVAGGVIIGAVLHLFIQVPWLFASGFQYQLKFKMVKEVIRVIKLAIPRTLGLVAIQMSFWINKIIAFTLGVGAVSVYYFANNLQSLPIGLFGVSIATAAFPHLAEYTNGKKKLKFVQTLSQSFCQILYLTVPISILFLLLRAQIVRLVLGTGMFDWQATINTANTLGFFAISIFAQSLVLLLSRAFYALQDTKTPVIINVLSLIINIVLGIILSHKMGIIGLGLAYSLANLFDMIVLLIVLRLRLEHFEDAPVIKCSFKIIIASFIMGLAVYGSLHLIAPFVDMHRFWGIATQALGASLVGLGIYLILGVLFKTEEAKIILSKLKKTNAKSDFPSL